MTRDSALLRPVRVLARRSKRGSRKIIRQLFFSDLIAATGNFANVKWLGHPVWQNVLDLWVIQEAIHELQPALLIEAGTNRGGSAMYYANLFDLMNRGRVITCDVERMHDLAHPRITFLARRIDVSRSGRCRARRDRCGDGPVMVILDSDHSRRHVSEEMETYCAVRLTGQPHAGAGRRHRHAGDVSGVPSGPLPAIREFLGEHAEFEPNWREARSS